MNLNSPSAKEENRKSSYFPKFLSAAMQQRYLSLGKFAGYLLVIFLVLLFALSAPKTIPYLTAKVDNTVQIDKDNIYVSDNAKLLSEKTKKEIWKINQQFKTLPNKPQLMVITVNKIPDNQDIESYTNNLANRFGIGDKAHESGIVYLLSKEDRKARLEVGYGMEDMVTDSMTDLITDAEVKNYYRDEKYDAGIMLVTKKLDQLIFEGGLNYEINRNIERDFLSDDNDEPFLLGKHLTITVIVLLVLLLIGLYFIQKQLNSFKARAQLDILAKHYYQDLKELQPDLTDADIRSNTALMQEAKTKLKNKILGQEKDKRPDYYDMNFAFGLYSFKFLVKNAQRLDDKFKKTSMYKQHKQDWYQTRKQKRGDDINKQIDEKYKNINPEDPTQYLLKTPKKWMLKIPLFFVSKSFWIILIFFSMILSYDEVSPSLYFTRIFSDFAVSILGFKTIPIHFIFYVSFFGLLIMFFYLFSPTKQYMQKTVRLNKMAKKYLTDLKKVSNAKDVLKTKLDKRAATPKAEWKWYAKPYPDYYDFLFAFGEINPIQFLEIGEPSEAIKSASFYKDHRNAWYKSIYYHPDTSSYDDETDYSNDHDSFGGGKFGGGGGTSSW